VIIINVTVEKLMSLRLLASLGLALVLAACGGGTSPDRFDAPQVRVTDSGFLGQVAVVRIEIGGAELPPDSISVGIRGLTYSQSGMVVCAREVGSNQYCGGPNTTTPYYIPSAGPVILDIYRLRSIANGWSPWVLSRFEIIFYRPNTGWYVGDQFGFDIDRITFGDPPDQVTVQYTMPTLVIR
jgi:hypothetical protein